MRRKDPSLQKSVAADKAKLGHSNIAGPNFKGISQVGMYTNQVPKGIIPAHRSHFRHKANESCMLVYGDTSNLNHEVSTNPGHFQCVCFTIRGRPVRLCIGICQILRQISHRRHPQSPKR
jgi:hypothetical protein